jgi:hypothetical protein
MARKVKIEGNMAAMLSYLGQLYQSPADALKEYISNALDAWRECVELGINLEPCKVHFRITPSRIVIEHNAPGMDEKEFEDRLKRVADSIKKGKDIAQIGQLGIGIWGFMQVGKKCTFFSKKAPTLPTLRVTLKEGRDDADFEKATKRESLSEPGMRIIISDLKVKPTKARGPLAVDRLEKKWGELFDSYLRDGSLELTIEARGETKSVKPPEIGLPRIAEDCKNWFLEKAHEKTFTTCYYYDNSGKGSVSVRHAGVDVIEDLGRFAREEEYWDENIYSSGFVQGYVEADFLKPLPSRTGFENNDDLLALLIELEKIGNVIEEEVDSFRKEEDRKRQQAIHEKALALARDILDDEDFMDLELLGGLAKRRRKSTKKESRPAGKPTGERSHNAGDHQTPSGPRINIVEDDFEDGSRRHSEFISGVVRINRLHPDYRQEMKGTDSEQLAYITMLIGKETIGFNDQSGISEEALERLLTYVFRLRRSRIFSTTGKGFRGRPRKIAV